MAAVSRPGRRALVLVVVGALLVGAGAWAVRAATRDRPVVGVSLVAPTELDPAWQGVDTLLDGLPNGFYIRNTDTTPRDLSVDPEFVGTVLEGQSPEPREVDGVTLAAIYAGDVDPSWWFYAVPESWPMHVTVVDGVVVRADEQYLP